MVLGQECLANILVSLYFVKHPVSPYLSHRSHLLTQSDSLQPTEGDTTHSVSVPPPEMM